VFLRHLDFLIDKVNQKSSANKTLKSVPRVLTSDNIVMIAIADEQPSDIIQAPVSGTIESQ